MEPERGRRHEVTDETRTRRSLSLTLPTETFNYLVLLATWAGPRTRSQPISLCREAYAMLERGFHEQKIPPAEP